MPLFQLRMYTQHLSFSQGTVLLSHSPQGVTDGYPGIPKLSCNISILVANFLKIQIPGPVPRPIDSKYLEVGPRNQYFQVSQNDLDILLDLGGLLVVGWSSFYRPLLNFPAVLWNSITLYFCLFPCCHLYHSPDFTGFSNFLDYAGTCSHILLPFYLLPITSVTLIPSQ